MTFATSQEQAEAAEFKPPFIDDKLIEFLERYYPDRSPEPDDTDRTIWMNRGAVGVVRHLRRIHTEQRENMLGE